jgi:hypothetical protein
MRGVELRPFRGTLNATDREQILRFFLTSVFTSYVTDTDRLRPAKFGEILRHVGACRSQRDLCRTVKLTVMFDVCTSM